MTIHECCFVRAVTRNKLQLVGCAAMLLASKYEEIYAPEVHAHAPTRLLKRP